MLLGLNIDNRFTKSQILTNPMGERTCAGGFVSFSPYGHKNCLVVVGEAPVVVITAMK